MSNGWSISWTPSLMRTVSLCRVCARLIWDFYAALNAYRTTPDKGRRLALRARFDRTFQRRTGSVTLGRLLARLHANKAELLMVLDRPEMPLHTSGSENDIPCHLTRRKVSGGTRSDLSRDCRGAFLGLAETRNKLGVAFWDYLGSRLRVPGQRLIPPLLPPLPSLARGHGILLSCLLAVLVRSRVHTRDLFQRGRKRAIVKDN